MLAVHGSTQRITKCRVTLGLDRGAAVTVWLLELVYSVETMESEVSRQGLKSFQRFGRSQDSVFARSRPEAVQSQSVEPPLHCNCRFCTRAQVVVGIVFTDEFGTRRVLHQSTPKLRKTQTNW